MNRLAVLTVLLASMALCSFAQTPGLIYKTAGSGAAVLDPNGDGYSSNTTNGFTTNDQTQSEIPYKALVVPAVEPVADPGPGPDCGFTDIVDSGSEDPVFTYYDASKNLLFRFRLGNTAANSKGYSIMIDTDQKFGFSGNQADPNAVSGNPGFEIEIVLRTNFGVSLYNVNGTTTPVLDTTYSYDNYVQKSVAKTTNCDNADYFYDFYIPFSRITSLFPSVNENTPLRMIAVTSMNPAPAIGNNAVSDVGGIDDKAYGYNFDNIFQTIIDNFTPTPITGIGTGTARDRSACPTITSPIPNSSTTIFGTSTEIGATIIVYKGTTEPLTQIGAAVVSGGGTWAAIVPAVSTNDVISATATNTNEGESYYSCSQVTVTNCSAPVPPYNLARESNRKYLSGTGTPGGTIKVYLLVSGSYVLQTGSFTLDPSGNGTFCWIPGSNTNSCVTSGSGTLSNGTTYYVSQTVGGCESAKSPICVDNQVSITPTLTQTTLYNTVAETISGTSGNNASITIYANGVSIATTTATSTTWTRSVDLSSHAGKYITIGAVEATKCIAIPLSAGVLVTTVPATSSTPIVTGTYCGTSTGTAITVSGTSTEAKGTVITVYKNGVSAGTTTVFNSTWSKVVTAKGGDVLTATATASGKTVSAISSGLTVSTSGSAPTVSFTLPIVEGASSLSGSFIGSGTLKIYIDGTLLGSTTSNSFTISGLTAFDLYAGGTLKATITSGGCESDLTATIATVDCVPPSNSVAVSPATSTICEGSTAAVTLTASQIGIIYQLYDGTTTTGSSRLGTGNNLVLTTGALTTNATIRIIALKISPVSCTDTLTATHTVFVTPAITSNTVTTPATSVFCQSGNPDQITGSLPTGGNGTYAYQWQSSTDNSSYSAIPGATGKNYDPGSLSQTTYFKRVVTSGSCQVITSTPAVITIENTSILNTISSLGSTSFTDSGVPSMDGNNSGGGTTYAWQSSGDNTTFSNTVITAEDYAPGTTINNTTYFRRIASNGLCSVISNVITYSVNHTPSVSDFSKSGAEDIDVNFSVTDFTAVYTDTDGHPLTQVRIESIPANGTLYSGATPLIAGSVVLLADLGNITFAPTANYNGSAAFSWKGHDGTIYSASVSDVTITISAVNDAPAGAHASVSATEDVIYSFSALDFSSVYSDVEGNAFAGIRITGMETAGSLILNGVDIAVNDVVSAVDLASSLLKFTPALNANGNGYATFTFQVYDGSDYSASSYTLTIHVNPVNDAPSAANTNATVLEDVAYAFTQADFSASYTDMEGSSFDGIKITSLPTQGVLKVNGVGATTNAILSATDLDASLLTFIPHTNENGNGYASFMFRVFDGTAYSTADYTITINVDAINDTPEFTKGSDQSHLTNAGAQSRSGWATAISAGPADESSQVLTFNVTNDNNTLFSVQPNIEEVSGNLTYTIAPAMNGTASVNVKLTDNGGVANGGSNESLVQNFTINVSSATNNPPVANDAVVTLNENSANTTAVHTVIATDIDGNTLSYTITAGNGTGAFSINSSTGAIAVADAAQLDYETTNQFILTVRVSDGSNNDNATITINLNNLNDNTPLANSATVSIDENSSNGTAVHTVVASDADGNTLSYSISAGNAAGAFAINSSTGAITVADASKLDYETTSQFVLTVKVSDGTNDTNATITINLNNLNDNTPVANSATVSIDENSSNGTAVHTVVASDADGNTLSYSISAGNTTGAFAINSSTGAITVLTSSQLNYETTSQFVLTVKVSDGTNDTNATITINLNNLNDNTPVANSATVSIDENSSNGTAVHTVVASDADGNTLSYSISAGNTTGAFAINSSTGAITVLTSSQLNYETTSQFVLTVKVSDGTNDTNATITINLNNLNDNTPVANSATVSIDENSSNGTAVHTVVASDADGNTLSYSISAGNTTGAFVINSSTGAITVADASKLDYETISQFVLTVKVSDGTNDDNATITINLNNLNDNTPVANSATVSIDENSSNGTAVHTVVASDADGNTLSYSISAGNTTGAFAINSSSGAITVADASKLDYETISQFVLTVKVSDGTNDDNATITINLNNLNDNTPVANSAIVSIDENSSNGTAVHTVVASDADGNTLSYSISAGNTTGAFAINSSTAAITVADASKLDYETTSQFVLTVKVSDGTNDTNATITINLNNLNDNTPVANSATVSIDENSSNGTAVHTVVASDADGNTLSYSISAGNTTGAFVINSSTGAISVADASKLDYETISQFVLTVKVSDGTNDDNATITINLNNLNDNTPVANSATVSIDENSSNGTAVHTVVASDADGNTLSYSISAGNTTGAFVINSSTGAITVADASKLDYETISQFVLTVKVSDGTNDDNATMTINLNNLNDNTPVANSATVSIDENSSNGTAVHTVVASDADGNTLSYSISAGNTTGAFAINSSTGAITVADASKLDYETTSQFVLTVTASDGTNDDNATITINLNNLNDNTPVANSATVSIDENSSNGTAVHTVVASDADGNTLSYSISAGNTTGAFAINSSSGAITVANASQLDYEITTQFSLTIKVSDGISDTNATVTININNLNDAGTIAPIPSASTSTIIASSSAIIADGITTTTIIIQLKDVNGNNLTTGGDNVNLSTTLGTLTTVTDNGDGTYTAILTSSTSAGTATITGTVNGILITDNAVTAFIPGPASVNMTTVTASVSSLPADGISTSVITIQLKDAHGNNLTAGVTMLTLSTTSGALSNVTDNGDGTYSAVLTSANSAETAIITAAINGSLVTDTEEVEFTSVPQPVLSATITSDVNSVPADGVSMVIVTIAITDQDNNAVNGIILDISATAGTLSEVTDNNDGTYTIILTSSSAPGSSIITASIEGISEDKTLTIEFTPITSPTFFIPEGFSPDGDGVNDTFVIQGAEGYTITLKVYNRWGNTVYEANAYKNDWEGLANQGLVLGQRLPDGTYFYAIDFNNGQKPYVRYFTIKRK